MVKISLVGLVLALGSNLVHAQSSSDPNAQSTFVTDSVICSTQMGMTPVTSAATIVTTKIDKTNKTTITTTYTPYTTLPTRTATLTTTTTLVSSFAATAYTTLPTTTVVQSTNTAVTLTSTNSDQTNTITSTFTSTSVVLQTATTTLTPAAKLRFRRAGSGGGSYATATICTVRGTLYYTTTKTETAKTSTISPTTTSTVVASATLSTTLTSTSTTSPDPTTYSTTQTAYTTVVSYATQVASTTTTEVDVVSSTTTVVATYTPIIKNGDFDEVPNGSQNIAPWQHNYYLSGVSYGVYYGGAEGTTARLDVGLAPGSETSGIFYQQLNCNQNAGVAYTVSFYYTVNNDNPNTRMSVLVGDHLEELNTVGLDNQWTSHTFTFNTVGGTTTLSFLYQGSQYATKNQVLSLDQVTVVPA